MTFSRGEKPGKRGILESADDKGQMREDASKALKMRSFLGNALLLATSAAVCLLGAELTVRALDDYPLLGVPLPLPTGVDTTAAHLAALPLAPGVDRAWFYETPRPLPNRKPVPEAYERRFREIERKHAETGSAFRGGDMLKAWNSVRVGDPCASAFFREAPALYL